MRILNKNKVFLALKTSDYNIDDFDFTETDDTLEIVYKPFDRIFKYHMISHPSDFDYFYATATFFRPKMPTDYRINPNIDGFTHIEGVVEDFIKWLNTEVKSFIGDQNQVDLWEEYKRGTTLLNVEQTDTIDTTEFTESEKLQIKMALNDLRINIPEHFSIDPSQINGLNARFDYLIDAVDRLNKTDWKGILIGQYIALITTLALNPDQAKNLYDLFIKVLHIIPLLNH